MIIFIRLFLIFISIHPFDIAASISFWNMARNDIMLNINKGYALRRIGIFGSTVDKQIVHTFVSIKDACVSLPSSEVCTFATSSTNNKILELATMVASKFTAISDFHQDGISKLIGQNLRQTLVQRYPEMHFNESHPIAHLIDNQLVSGNENEDSSSLSLASNEIDLAKKQQQQTIPRFLPTLSASILGQISNQKLGLDFMSNYQLKNFLTAVFLTIDQSYVVSDIHESLNTFNELVVGQSYFALRYCSLNEQQSVSKQPCLVVSTLFVKPSTRSSSTYTVYQLILLPTIVDSHKYVYSNMPKFVGMSATEQTIITWNEQSEIDHCSFSVVVLCFKIPLAIPFLKSPCLLELFNDEMNLTLNCQVIRSIDTQSDITEIGSSLWLFHNVQNTQFCQVYSDTTNSVETIAVSEDTAIRVPCGKAMTCFGNHLPPGLCTNYRIMISPTNIDQPSQQDKIFKISLKNAATRILSTYRIQNARTYQGMVKDFMDNEPFFKQKIHEIGYATLSIICSSLLLAMIYILKCSSKKLQNDLDTLHEVIHDVLLQK